MMKRFKTSIPFKASVAVITGSGLGKLLPDIEIIKTVPYSEIKGFPASQVKGHKGELVFGEIDKIPVLLFRGRLHVYEGHSAHTASITVKIAVELGADNIYLTNASGGIADFLEEGSLMLIRDHINFMGTNPLINIPVADRNPDFLDMTHPYCPEMIKSLRKCASQKNIVLKEGVLASLTGPCYETPAEVKMLKTLGADAVSMSVVPEVIMANYLNINVSAISVITNKAASTGGIKITHKDTLAKADLKVKELSSLISLSIKELCR